MTAREDYDAIMNTLYEPTTALKAAWFDKHAKELLQQERALALLQAESVGDVLALHMQAGTMITLPLNYTFTPIPGEDVTIPTAQDTKFLDSEPPDETWRDRPPLL